MKTIISIFLLTFLSGCITKKACERKFPHPGRDSVSVVANTVTLIRDTTIYVRMPGDTVFGSVPVFEVSTLTAGTATSTARVMDGMLLHRMEQRDTAVAAHLKGALRTTSREIARKEVVYRTQYTNQLTGWQWFQVWVGRILTGVLVMLVVWRGMWRKG